MEPWIILNIAPTEDVSIIKKAYAKMLKIHHPEDDPKGYQKLRQAYDTALKYARRSTECKDSQFSGSVYSISTTLEDQSTLIPKEFPNSDETDNSENILSPIHIELLDNQTQTIHSTNEQNAEFMVQVESLYNDFFSRIVVEKWENILNNDILWMIDNKENISYLMLDFLSSHRYLPHDIWVLLDKYFNWCSIENVNHHISSRDFLLYIQKQIKQSNPPDYSFFKFFEGVDYEKFLENRENAYLSFSDNNLSATNFYIERAKNIYQDDPDLLHLEGKTCLRSGDLDGAIQAFNKVLLIKPNDIDVMIYRAAAYYEKNLIQECLEDYNRIYSKMPDKKEILLHMAKSYLKIGAFEKAKEWTIKALEIDPSFNEAKSLLSQIYAKLRSQIMKEIEKDPLNKELDYRLDEVTNEMLSNGKIRGEQKSNNGSIRTKAVTKNIKSPFMLILCATLILIILAIVFSQILGTGYKP